MDINLHNNLDIVLRNELEWMLKNWGYSIILVRSSEMLCTCASREGQQATSFCTKCMGIGRRISLEKHTVVGLDTSQAISRPNATKYGKLGDISSHAKKFYSRYSLHPNIGSYIYEVSWDKNKLINIMGVYKIEYAEPFRMDGGKIEYYALSTHREVVNLKFKEEVLRKIYNK